MMSWALGLALLAASGPKDILQPYGPEGLTKPKPRRLALLIGIESFEDPRFTTLRYAQDDALALGARLSKEGFDEVRVLTHPDETSRAAIVAALRRLMTHIQSPDDLVFVYVSSHGSLGHAPGGPLQRFLVAKDTRLDVLYETGISVPWLIDSIERFPSERTTIVLATCHSGIGKSVVPDDLTKRLARLKSGPALDLTDVSRAMVVLSASAFGEAARESDTLGHDVYTHFFSRPSMRPTGMRTGR